MVSGSEAVLFDQEFGGQRKRVWHQFTQRRMRIWRPMHTPRCITTAFGACGVILFSMGLVILVTTTGLAEFAHDYTDDAVDAATNVGYFDIEVDRYVEPPIWVSYELNGFYQSHRRHKESCSVKQWGEEAAELASSTAQLETCEPLVHVGGRVLYPCGLVAQSVFNDSYVLQVRDPDASQWQRLEVDSSPSTISWSSDIRGRFHNLDPEAVHRESGQRNQVAMDMWILGKFPPVTCEQVVISEDLPYVPVTVATRTETRLDAASGIAEQVNISDCRGFRSERPTCNFLRDGEPFDCTGNYQRVVQKSWGLESGHFINWVRIAGLSSFRKLWGKIDIPLRAGSTIRVHYRDNFPVKGHRARKALVIYTGSVLGGGRDDILAWGFMGAGSLCLILCLVFMWFIVVRPRRLGDISRLASSWQ